MGKLKLNFIDDKNSIILNPLEKILHEFGEEIYEYAKGYFNYIVTTTSLENVIKEASLYIIVPEINYDYKVLTLEQADIENIKIYFYTLKTKQTEINVENIKNGYSNVENRIATLLNTKLANETFRFLVNQVLLKRENRNE